MISIRKIRPLSEVHYAVCLSGMWRPHCPAQWLRSGCRASRLVLEESHWRGEIQVQRLGYRTDFNSHLLVILSAQISLEAHI